MTNERSPRCARDDSRTVIPSAARDSSLLQGRLPKSGSFGAVEHIRLASPDRRACLELSVRGPAGALLAAVSRLESRSFRLPISIPLEQIRPGPGKSFRWLPSARLEIPGTSWDGTAIRVRRRDLQPLLDAIDAGGARLRSAPTRTEED